MRAVAAARRNRMIAPAGSTPDGHASEHSQARWHRQAARSLSISCRTGPGSRPRGSSTSRQAAARAAGPTYRGSLPATGQADRQMPHSMQSS